MTITEKQQYEAPEITDLEIHGFAVVQGASPEGLGGGEDEDPL